MTGDGGGQAMHVSGQPHMSPIEECTNLQGFSPSRDHKMLVEVYGDHLQHNDWTQLDGGIT